MRKKEPKYVDLALQLKYEIEQGKLQPGDRLPTFKELHERQGISQFTYEKAYDVLQSEGIAVRLRGRYGGVFVPPRQKAAPAKPIGYFQVGQSKYLHLGYFSHLIEGVRHSATEYGCQVLLVDEIYAFKDWDSISAALVVGAQPMQVSTLRQQAPADLPFISLVLPTEGVPGVVPGDFQGAYRAVQYLLELGHRKIGFASYPASQHVIIQLRKNGYLKALTDAGIEPQESWRRESFLLKATTNIDYLGFGRDLMQEWLEEGFLDSGCTAFIAQNDNIAYGAHSVLQAAGVRVPEDISIIGFDGIDFANPLISPKLTTMEVPLRELGLVAVNHAFSAQAGASTITLPMRLRVGETTAARCEG